MTKGDSNSKGKLGILLSPVYVKPCIPVKIWPEDNLHSIHFPV